MNTELLLECQWPYLMSFLPPEAELDRSAREMGGLTRRRAVKSASDLLRLALAYGFCGLTLRQTAAWAQVADVAQLSDVALLKRLRSAADWLGHILAVKLAEKAPPPPSWGGFRLRLLDATVVSKPGSVGTDWRVHLGFALGTLAIDHIELTDASGGESLTRFPLQAGQLAVGDRGYAHRGGLAYVREAGADFLIRLNWQTVPLLTPTGQSFDLLTFLRALSDAVPAEAQVCVAPCRGKEQEPLPARLLALRKTEAAAEAARLEVLREHSRKGKSPDPRTLETAGYFFALTSVPATKLTCAELLDLYRFRWQIELAFKRLKSLLHLDQLPARDPPLARSFLFAKLLAALLLEDFTDQFLAFSPWGFRLASTTAVAVAHPASPPGRDALRDGGPDKPPGLV